MGAKTMAEENGETRASRGRSNKCESREYARANIDVIHTNTHGWRYSRRGGCVSQIRSNEETCMSLDRLDIGRNSLSNSLP